MHIDDGRDIDPQVIKEIKDINRLVREKWGIDNVKAKL